MANSKKRCKHCLEYFRVESGRQLPAGFFCSIDHAVEFGGKKAKAKKEKESRAAHKVDKERIKKKGDWLKEAQAEFNLFIRIRDFDKDCISCGASKAEIEVDQGWKVGGCWDAGHYKGRGAKPQLRFNCWNVHKQCKKCNGGGGKFSAKAATVDAEYEERLRVKIGFIRVEDLNNDNSSKSFDVEYLKRVKRIFAKRARIYKKIKGL